MEREKERRGIEWNKIDLYHPRERRRKREIER